MSTADSWTTLAQKAAPAAETKLDPSSSGTLALTDMPSMSSILTELGELEKSLPFLPQGLRRIIKTYCGAEYLFTHVRSNRGKRRFVPPGSSILAYDLTTGNWKVMPNLPKIGAGDWQAYTTLTASGEHDNSSTCLVVSDMGSGLVVKSDVHSVPRKW